MKDKKITEKLHLFVPLMDKSLLSFSARLLNRYLTKDEVYLVSCAEKTMKITDVIGMMKDTKYVISLLNDLMESGIIRDSRGRLMIGKSFWERKPRFDKQFEDTDDVFPF